MTQPDRPLVLIVDDNPDNLRVVAGTLEAKGYSTAAAMNADETLHFLATERPELILLDVMMPGMDGYELCKRIKNAPGYKDIPVIFLTARSDTDDVVQGFAAGAVDYVAKPFSGAELIARVKTHIELRRAREEIKTLHGIVPICSSCKSIRDIAGAWHPLEKYLTENTDASLSHGVCPTCARRLYPELAKRVLGEEK